MTLEDQFKEDMTAIVDAISKNINGMRTVVFNTVSAQMSNRIFQQGKASDGTDIGEYAASTKRIRKYVGRRIDKVDLEMSGELRESLVVAVEGDEVVMGFIGNTEPKISIKGGTLRVTGKTDYLVTDNAIDQEERFKKDIFAPSEDEVKKGDDVFLFQIDKLIKKTLGKNKTIKVQVKRK